MEWTPVDLAPYLNGIVPLPTLLRREDGNCLLYPGQVHWVQGPPQSGKTWVAVVAAAQVLATGGTVAWVDVDGTPPPLLTRLRQLGVEQFDNLSFYPYPSQYSFPREIIEGDLLVVDGAAAAEDYCGGPIRWRTAYTAVMLTQECESHAINGMYGPGRFPVYAAADVAYHCSITTIAGKHIRLRLCKDRHGQIRHGRRGDYPAVADLWIHPDGYQLVAGRESAYEAGSQMERAALRILRAAPGIDVVSWKKQMGTAAAKDKERLVQRLADDGIVVSRITDEGQVWFLADDPEVAGETGITPQFEIVQGQG